MSYESKYLKYKNKYLSLKKNNKKWYIQQNGGGKKPRLKAVKKRAFKDFSYSFNLNSKCIAFGKGSNRYPKFRRKCICDFCIKSTEML